MLVYEARDSGGTTYVDVSGTPLTGYRIVRQHLTSDGETETTWVLTPEQAAQLRSVLGPAAIDDTLTPSDPDSGRYDFVLTAAMEGLEPPAAPFTWVTHD